MGPRWSWVVALGACSYTPSPANTVGDGAVDSPSGDAPDAAVAARCDPLPRGPATLVSDIAALRMAIQQATPSSTIEIADGTYDLASNSIAITVDGVTLRSTSGDASKVVIEGAGIANRMIGIAASNVTLTELTIAHAGGIGVKVEPPATNDITGVRIHDVTFADDSGPAIQLVPFNGTLTGPFADGGTISCSRFIDTPAGADHCSPGTLGIDGHAVRDWTVRDNLFQDVRCEGGLSRNVAFRFGSRDTTLVNNVFRGSNMNILFGGENASRTYGDALPIGCTGVPDHWGGVICNNVIDGQNVPPNTASTTDFEEGIALWTVCDAYVIHNTIASPIGAETFHDIEYRFTGTFVHLVNNLLEQLPASRDGGAQDSLFSATNVQYALVDFADPANGDLHLSPTSTVPAGAPIGGLSMCGEDLEGKPRDLAAPDPGAYER